MGSGVSQPSEKYLQQSTADSPSPADIPDLVNSYVAAIAHSLASNQTSLATGTTKPFDTMMRARKWSNADALEVDHATNLSAPRVLPRINSIQSIALTHKLKRLGSYIQMVNLDNLGPSKSTYKISFDRPNSRLVLDPLSGMKRIASTPAMKFPSADIFRLSPAPLSEIQEVENESYPASPVKGPPPCKPFPKLTIDLGEGAPGGGASHSPVASASESKPPVFKPPRLTLSKMTSFEDDEDWGLVSDDENETSMVLSPRASKPKLSLHATETEESYRITESGTIWIDELKEVRIDKERRTAGAK